MSVLPVFSVGCVEGSFPLYLEIAAATQEDAKDFVKENRPRLEVISVVDSDMPEMEVDKPKIIKMREA